MSISILNAEKLKPAFAYVNNISRRNTLNCRESLLIEGLRPADLDTLIDRIGKRWAYANFPGKPVLFEALDGPQLHTDTGVMAIVIVGRFRSRMHRTGTSYLDLSGVVSLEIQLKDDE